MLTCALMLTGLAACETSGRAQAPLNIRTLPPVPADIQACFRGVVDIPNRALTVAEVERLWSQDRLRSAAQRQCGQRLIDWHEEIRANWI